MVGCDIIFFIARTRSQPTLVNKISDEGVDEIFFLSSKWFGRGWDVFIYSKKAQLYNLDVQIKKLNIIINKKACVRIPYLKMTHYVFKYRENSFMRL